MSELNSLSSANDLAMRLCHIATTKFSNKDQECADLTAAAKELTRLEDAKGGKWCKDFFHWIAVTAKDCTSCSLEKQNVKVFQVARRKIMDILVQAELITESESDHEKCERFGALAYQDIPEAIDFERKRCANVNPIEFKCTTCKSEIDEFCVDNRCVRMTTSFHNERWRTSIMTRPGESK